MAQYKVIPFPERFTINKKESINEATKQLSDFLNSVASEGWELLSTQEIMIEQKPGCIDGLLGKIFGKKASNTSLKVGIFKK